MVPPSPLNIGSHCFVEHFYPLPIDPVISRISDIGNKFWDLGTIRLPTLYFAT